MGRTMRRELTGFAQVDGGEEEGRGEEEEDEGGIRENVCVRVELIQQGFSGASRCTEVLLRGRPGEARRERSGS